MATTFSTVKPKCLKTAGAGADSPKRSMPTTAPSPRTYFHQKSVTPASIATRGRPSGRTPALYCAVCRSNTVVDGIDTTRTGDAGLREPCLRLDRQRHFRAGRDQHRAQLARAAGCVAKARSRRARSPRAHARRP